MAKIIDGENNLAVWKQAGQFLENNGNSVFNLILTVNEPTQFDQEWLSLYDPNKLVNKAPSVENVIKTIFPYQLLRDDKDANFIYNCYKRAHRLSKLRRHWGTYFLRMISYGPGEINQLQRIIDAASSTTSTWKGSYYIHITDPSLESNVRPFGGPCLQYIQISMSDINTLNLTAVYRNHDYFNRTFGNLLGLSFLLKFICRESNKDVGTICCHSMHAFYGSSNRNFKKLLAGDTN